MSGGLFLKALERAPGMTLDEDGAERRRQSHARGLLGRLDQIRPLPGARELLAALSSMRVPWAIATSGAAPTAGPTIAMLGVPQGTPVVTRDQVAYAKPNPDLFLAAAERLGVPPGDCFVVGDSIWDLLAAQRAGALGGGVLSGGYGREELEQAGGHRGYAVPADRLARPPQPGDRAA